MTAPRRIQRQRTKGWRMPPGCIYVGRPTIWGNPFWLTSRHPIEVAASVDYYRRWLAGEPGLGAGTTFEGAARVIRRLHDPRGRDLCCWCPPGPCHADVLLELANE